MNEKNNNWIKAHVQMFDFFGGVTPMLVSDNCTTAVKHKKSDWYNTALNTTYHEMAEHYNLAILPDRVRKPKDKPNVEGSVGKISTWIIAALRNEQFFFLAEVNASIREKLDVYLKCLERIKVYARGWLNYYGSEEMSDDQLEALTPWSEEVQAVCKN